MASALASAMATDPLTGAVTQPSDAVQTGFGKVIDGLIAGAKNWATLPGRAYQEGITPDQAVDWAAPTAMGMIGMARMPGAAPAGALGSSGAKLVQPEGIRAYHGSPYDFDKFDLGKIGTGEGAQSYGHGLYFAEAEPVARSYRDTLARQSIKTPDGKTITPSWDDPAFNAVQYFNQAGGDVDKAIELAKSAKGGGLSDLHWKSDIVKVLDEYRGAGMQPNPPGRMYEVNINAKPEQFLDWDKPLALQGGAHRALDDVYWTQHAKSQPDIPSFLKSPQGAREMQDLGIPGIRYLDQGSRAAGDGSRNYVVFNPKIIDIMRKYGLAGIPGASAVAAAMNDQQQQ